MIVKEMKELLERYNLEKMIDVVADRSQDYSNIKEDFEESFKGEMETNPDKYYEHGYGETLDNVAKLLTELKKYSWQQNSFILNKKSKKCWLLMYKVL